MTGVCSRVCRSKALSFVLGVSTVLFNNDMLLFNIPKAAHCTEGRCMGSLMQPYGGGEENRPYGVPRPKEEVKAQATAFLEEYYASIQR